MILVFPLFYLLISLSMSISRSTHVAVNGILLLFNGWAHRYWKAFAHRLVTWPSLHTALALYPSFLTLSHLLEPLTELRGALYYICQFLLKAMTQEQTDRRDSKGQSVRMEGGEGPCPLSVCCPHWTKTHAHSHREVLWTLWFRGSLGRFHSIGLDQWTHVWVPSPSLLSGGWEFQSLQSHNLDPLLNSAPILKLPRDPPRVTSV